jgi:glycosyltransferase involved in cell wall biosynthesis/GT2 family glycosyltransferase
MTPSTAVVVATWRRPDALARCLEGLAVQELPPSDVVVAVRPDDEQGRRVVASAPGARAREVVVTRPGTVAARNAGLAACDAEVVAFIDDDAVPAPDWTARLAAHYADPVVGAVGGRDRVHHDGVLVRGPVEPVVGRVLPYGRFVGFHHLGGGAARPVELLKGVNMSVRTAALGGRGFDSELRGEGAVHHEDWALSLRIARAGWTVVYDPAITVDHHEAPREGGTARIAPTGRALSDRLHNQTYAAVRYLPWRTAAAHVGFAVALGTTVGPGLLQGAVRIARRPEDARATAALVGATLRGRLAGVVSGLRARRADRRPDGVRQQRREGAGAVRILFVNQGRARAGAALGVVRAQQAIELGVPAAERGRFELEFAVVPPFTLTQRIATHRVPYVGWSDLLALRWHVARSWAGRRLIGDRLRSARPDVVHISTVQVAFLLGSTRRRVPCVLAVDMPMIEWTKRQQGLHFEDSTPPNLKPLEMLERRALERAPLCIAWTETVARRIASFAPRAQVRVLHPGIDLHLFRPADGERADGPLRVLFVGGRWADKGGPDLLAALEPDLGTSVELDVVTPATDVPQRPGVTVHGGSTPGSADTAALFRRADVFCLPTYVDGTPLVVVEALASGVPVVSTRVGSIPELAGDAGMVVAPGDVAGLREAIGTLAGDPGLRARMGAAARARAEDRYDARRNTQELLRILERVARTEPGR